MTDIGELTLMAITANFPCSGDRFPSISSMARANMISVCPVVLERTDSMARRRLPNGGG